MTVPAGHPDHIPDGPFIGACDSCSEDARVIYQLDVAELRFCDTHSIKNAPALRSAGWTSNRYVPA